MDWIHLVVYHHSTEESGGHEQVLAAYKNKEDAIAVEEYLNAYIREKWNLFERDRAVDFNTCMDDLRFEFNLSDNFYIWDWSDDSFSVTSYPIREN